MKKMRKLALIFVILAMTAPLALGKTLYVQRGYSGSDSAYFTGIQDAWDAAAENDTIEIYGSDQAYKMCSLNLAYKNGITMRARAGSGGMLYEHVVVQNWGYSNTIYCRGPDRMTFEGLIFRGKGQHDTTAGNNYGIYVRSPFCDDMTFDHCIFTEADSYGMYLYYAGRNFTIDHCSFIKNEMGLRCYTSSYLTNGKITNTIFYDNNKWVPESWDGVGGYTPGYWSGYAAELRDTDGFYGSNLYLQNCVVYDSYGSGGPRTDGSNSLTRDAVLGTGSVANLHKPVMLSTSAGNPYFGYLDSNNNVAAILNGSDTGGYIGARPALSVPEPATISLLALGLLAIRRRRK
jgi:hypothetical protein